MESRLPVGVVGATGAVGQRFVQLLNNHPWFEVVTMTGSARSVGQLYGNACRWLLPEPMPDWARDIEIVSTSPKSVAVTLVFSALPSKAARELEPVLAQAGIAVFSNASAYRQEPDVPIILPEVNPEHAELVGVQRRNRGWTGCIVTNPNCTSAGLTVPLNALNAAFGVERVFVVSLQALSGAGHPGVASLDIQDNVVPFINGEEEKVQWEPLKMLGRIQDDRLHLASIQISAHSNRVAVSDGHMLNLSIGLSRPAEIEEVSNALQDFTPPPESRDLPSTPVPVIHVRTEPDRPQPRLDRLTGRGMTTVVGRLRSDPILDCKMVVLSHNTIRGAAGGSIYNAELLLQQGIVS